LRRRRRRKDGRTCGGGGRGRPQRGGAFASPCPPPAPRLPSPNRSALGGAAAVLFLPFRCSLYSLLLFICFWIICDLVQTGRTVSGSISTKSLYFILFTSKKSTTIRSLAARPARRWRCPRTLARANHAPRNHRSRSPGSFNHGVPKWKLKSPRNNCDSAPSSSPQLYASCNHSPRHVRKCPDQRKFHMRSTESPSTAPVLLQGITVALISIIKV